MQRFTLSNFRSRWPAEAMGICNSDPAVANYCNQAQEQLLMDPMCPETGWWGTWMRMNFTVTVSNGTAYITTPRQIARLTDIAVCNQPIHIRNGFYEFLAFSSGVQPKTCQNTGCGSTFQAFDRDSVFTLAPLLSTPQTIRVYPSDARDSGLRVLLQGKDQNGMIILTTDPNTGLSAPGEYISIAFPFSDSTYQYSEITGLMKDETYGPITFFQVDPSTSVELPLSAMEPEEGTGLYRRYMINGIPNTNLCCASPGSPITVQAQARLDFVPVINENDYLTLPNVAALLEESMSIRYGRMESGSASQQSQLHHQKALNLLVGQLDLYEGKWRPSVKVPLFGSNRMRPSFR
jgi:hypothetical protein